MLGYKVNSTLSLDVLKTLKTSGPMTLGEVNGIKFNYFPEKVATFLKISKCICCGIEALEVGLEEGKGTHAIFGMMHLNVYARAETTWGEFWDLMTVDHDVLKSRGGPDVESNFNTMCRKCNQLRGSRYPKLEDFLARYAKHGQSLINSRAASLHHYRLCKREKGSEEYQAIVKHRNEMREAKVAEYISGLCAAHVGDYNRHKKALYKALTAKTK